MTNKTNGFCMVEYGNYSFLFWLDLNCLSRQLIACYCLVTWVVFWSELQYYRETMSDRCAHEEWDNGEWDVIM